MQTTTEIDSIEKSPVTITTTDLLTATPPSQIPSSVTEFDATESSPTHDATSRGTLAIHGGYVVPDTLNSVTLLVHNSYGNNSLLWVIVFISFPHKNS